MTPILSVGQATLVTGAAVAASYARRAWRRMVMDICAGLFMVLLLVIASAFLVFALYAFAADLLPRYAAAAIVSAVAFIACGAIYLATAPRKRRKRAAVAAAGALGAKPSGSETAEVLARELSKTYSPTVVVALLAGLAAVRPSSSRVSPG